MFATSSNPSYPTAHLLGMPKDIRLMIYDFYYPVAKHIHLTFGSTTQSVNAESEEPTDYKLSADGINLMRVCKQLNEEISGVVYGKNSFFMVPSEDLAIAPHLSQRNITTWVHHLRASTQQLVKKLDIHIDLPLDTNDALWLVYGLSQFPNVEVSVESMKAWLPKARLEQSKALIELFRGILPARAKEHTTWNDRGDHQIAQLFRVVGIQDKKSGPPPRT